MPAAPKALNHVALDAPRHRADEPFRWRRRVGRTDFQDLRHQRRVTGNPVAHHDSPAGPRHPDHLLRDIKRLRRKHRAKNAHDEIKTFIFQRRADCVASPSWNLQLPSPAPWRALVAGLHQVRCDIDTQHVRAEPASGNAVVPSPQPRSRTFMPCVMPSFWTSASPLSRMVAAMRVKSPFSQSALFGFIGSAPCLAERPGRLNF